ncbi:MAG: exo-alpha-sialidase, partial [Planctomycetes bacterium]|nr:exo-alpha-sialidase [Planctomycetota bacterium]
MCKTPEHAPNSPTRRQFLECSAAGALAAYLPLQAAPGAETTTLTLKSKTLLGAMSPLSGAIYQKPTGLEMIKRGAYSPDNGRTWESIPARPNFDADLPYGYRRSPLIPWVDPKNGNVLVLLNCMDTPDKDPHAHEPRWQWYWYYLRYRVSTDGGRAYLCDEPIVQEGDQYSPKHPIDGVHIGKNCFFIGDSGCRPLRTREGTLLVPMQTPPLNPDQSGFHNPGGGWYWLDSMILIGRWTDQNRIAWHASQPIRGDGNRTARGLYEPTLAQLPDGKILCVMRG